MRLIHRIRKSRDAGVSLVEMLVVMALLSVVGTMATSLVISTMRHSATQQIRMDDIDNGRIGIDALTRTLRTAVQPAQLQIGCTSCTGAASTSTALTSADGTSVQFFANFGAAAGPTLMTFTIAFNTAKGTATLTETRQPPDAGSAPNFTYTTCTPGPTCGIKTRTLIAGISWPLPAPVFTYYDNAGAILTPGASGLSSTQRITVSAVEISLPVQAPNRYGTTPLTLNSRVRLPNSASGVLPTPTP